MPERVQLSRKKGWRKPPNTVVVSRPSKWGNPYKVVHVKNDPEFPGEWATVWISQSVGDVYIGVHEERAEAFRIILDTYRELLIDNPTMDIHDLTGRNLACWCPLDQPCHADVLLELANQPLSGPTHREAK